MFTRRFLAACLILSGAVACKNDSDDKTAMNNGQEGRGIYMKNMDTTVSPKEDFYRYANGAWLDSTAIPDDQTTWGGFQKLRKDTDADVLTILEKASKDKNLVPNSDQAKAVYLFESILDTVARNNAGYKPIKPYLDKVEKINTVSDIQRFHEEMSDIGYAGFWAFGIGPDAEDTDKNVAGLYPGQLGLSREYYVADDEDSRTKLKQYQDHIYKVLVMMGTDKETAKQDAATIVRVETAMAEPRLDKTSRRDPLKTYNPMTVSDLSKMDGAIDWVNYFDALPVEKFNKIIVSQPEYLKAMSGILQNTPLEDLKKYMKWTLIDDTASYLTTELERQNWEFYSKTMSGAKSQRPSEERALSVVNSTVGEALGKLYVDEKFPPEAKQKAEEMIGYVKKAYASRIDNLDWMSPETKKKAKEKLAGITVKIGYPDKWKDYSDMDVSDVDDGGTLFDNMIAVSRWIQDDQFSRLGKDVDKSEWFMSPQTVNAYYNPYYNEIVFPAAILQPPFYDFEADAAVNFGGMGAVIGHEISHGFDDTGAKYDAEGTLVNWWTEDDKIKFDTLGSQLARQYDKQEVLPGVFINGNYTLGENIGDLGGVNAAYDAMKMWLADKGAPGEIDGYTPEQRFFLSWATVWRTKMREQALRQRIKNDTHSPGMYRGYVPLQNMDEFYEAFDIKEGDKMYVEPDQRVRIW